MADTLTERYQQIRDEQPSANTVAWWRSVTTKLEQTLSGALLQTARTEATARDCWAEVKNQRQRCKELAGELEECRAMIGELTATVIELKGTQQKMGDWIKTKLTGKAT